MKRFWEKVDKRGPDDCWEWMASTRSGYGIVYAGGGSTGAHRVAYELANGPIPNDMFVCHSCDNRTCVNPGHLWLGTHLENMRDMVEKGRGKHASGEDHPRAKVSKATAMEIRRLFDSGLSVREIHRRLRPDCSLTNVNSIARRKSWKNVRQG